MMFMNRSICSFFVLVIFSLTLSAQNNVGIGTPAPDASSILELNSTNSGFLVPRVNSAQRTAIAAPANALLVFDTDSGCFFYFTAAQWVSLCKLSGPVGPTGLTGAGGANGVAGPTGIAGVTGADGATGIQGNTGIQGIAGLAGATGVAGPTGSTGAAGVPGVAGATGVAGISGVTGPTGPLGTAGGDLSGLYPNPTVIALQGNAVSSSAPAANDLLLWNGTAWTPTDGNGLFWKITGNSGTSAGTNFAGTTDAQDFVLKTSGVEAMRITAGSNVRIGSASFANQCAGAGVAEDPHVRLSSVGGFVSLGSYNNDPAVNAAAPSPSWMAGVGSLVIGMNRNSGSSNVDFWNNSDPANGAAALGNTNRGFNFRNFQSSGGCAENLLMTLDGNGNLTLSQYVGGGGTANAYAFNTISDKRVKQNIQKIQEPVIDKIMRLNPVTYDYSVISYEPNQKLEIKRDAYQGRESGFLAQEVYQLFPEAVSKPKDESKNLWAMDYSKLTVVLTKAMQEQQQMILDQKAEIEKLKADVELLKKH